MNQIVNPNAQKRWVTNAMFLCESLTAIKGPGVYQDNALTKYLENKCAYIIGLFNQEENFGILQKSEDTELQAFYITCKKEGQNQIDPRAVNENIQVELLCMSPSARKIASSLVHPYTDNKKPPQKQAFDVTESLLGLCYKTGYLNRLICLLAEEMAKEKSSYTVLGEAGAWEFKDGSKPKTTNVLLSIYLNAQRVRSSQFGKAFVPDPVPTTIKTWGEAFKKAQGSHLSPFNKEIHRRRTQKHGVITNKESYLMSSTAGAAFTQLAPDSTLGLVEKALSLPERCDISGTTTDAIGAALTMCVGEYDGLGLYAYIMACMTSMSLSGHHSLSEMGAALSLWSNVAYNPLKSAVVHQTIENLFNVSGEVTQKTIWHDEDNKTNWYSHEWLAFAGTNYKGTLDKWDFTEANWMVWKAFANVLGRK